MKLSKISRRIILSLFFTLIFCLFIPQTVFGQTENLGIVNYTPPKGWNKTAKENRVAFSEFDKVTGKFCVITLYGATPGKSDSKDEFTKEWDNLLVKSFNVDAKPETESQVFEGWTITQGGTAVNTDDVKGVAYLTVLNGFGKTISILTIFNDKKYMEQISAFIGGIEIKDNNAKTTADDVKTTESKLPESSPNTVAMHAAALVKEFENNEIRANQEYIGKRIRIHGTVNIIEIAKDGQIVLTFKSSITTRNNARCYFPKSESSRVAGLNANEDATVEGTVQGLGDGFEGAKAYLVLKNCIVP